MSDDREAIDQYAMTAAVLEAAPNAAVIANLGVASWVLAEVDDRDRNFYMRGGMGSTTPTGFGLALAIDDEVIVLDGDGSLLMGLGALATAGEYDPSNLTVVVCNNAEFGTTGGQPSLADGVNFAAIAEDCGLAGFSARSESGFESALSEALAVDGAALVDCAVEPTDVGAPPEYDYSHAYLTDRFRRSITE
ncbi:MAG: thiamine pyrophosphate-dependent enzyme [Halobacteriales archaeon]|nr:thiamine pyrophosphate-dependent enzyme [Halobacteriales archaeon]